MVVDITDLRAKQPTLFHRLRLDDFLFENLYLRNGDFDDEDESVVSEVARGPSTKEEGLSSAG